MTPKQAIHILMLSPCYWRLNLSARKQLVREYCASYEEVWRRYCDPAKNTPKP